MEIDDNLITYLEDLSRLKLSNEEKEKEKNDLGKILTYMEKLNELDTTDVEPTSHPFTLTNNLRKDIRYQSYDRNLMLKNAPEKKDGYFKVPKTIE